MTGQDSGRIPVARVAFDLAPLSPGHLILSHHPKRISITWFPPGNGQVTLANDPVTALGNGITLQAGQGAITLSLQYHGEAVQREWYGIYSAGAYPVSWIEMLG